MEANGRLEHSKGYVEANGMLQRWNSKGLWPECLVEAAARDFRRFRVFKAGKRQA